MRALLFSTILAVSLFIPPSLDAFTYKVSLGTGDIIPIKTYRAVITEAYKRTGNKVEFLVTPTFRSADLVAAGLAVAEAVRVEDFIVMNSKLNKVPVVIGSIDVSILSMHPFTDKITKHSLIGARVGTLKSLQFLTNYMPFQKFLWMKNLEVLVKKLVSGQLDYIVYTPDAFQKMARKWYPKSLFFEQPLVRRNLFHYVSKNRMDLVKPLSLAFQTMVDDGYIMKKMQLDAHKVDDYFLRRVQ